MFKLKGTKWFAHSDDPNLLFYLSYLSSEETCKHVIQSFIIYRAYTESWVGFITYLLFWRCKQWAIKYLKKTRKYIEFSFTFWEKDISILVSGTFKLSRHTRCTSYCKLLNMSTCGISMSVQVTNHLIYQFETHQYLQRRVVHKSMLIKPCCKSRRPKNFT